MLHGCTLMADVEIRKPVPLRNVPAVELAAVGTWAASTGVTTFTPEDLAGAVAALECPGVRNPVLKLGHDEPDSTSGVRWDGEPAVGWIGNMRMDGAKLLGDYMGMPEWLAGTDDSGNAILATAYPDRSIEIRRPFVCQIGHTHPSVITAVALLGVYAPGVGVLKSMQDVYAAFTTTAGDEIDSSSVNLASPIIRTTVRLAADDAPREMTEVERRSGVDFAGEQERWQTALDDLLGQWDAIGEAQRDELSAQIAAAVDNEPDRLGELAVDAAAAALLLRSSVRSVAAEAAEQQVAAAARQGVIITDPGLDDDEVDGIADAVAAAMAASTASTAGRTAAQSLGTGDGATIAAATVATLADFTDRFLRDQLGGALSAAQAAGRFRVLEIAPIGEWYGSEINDQRTCSPCKSIDGQRFDTLDEARAAYGSGKYVGCQGGARCRGQVVATWGTALSAPISTTVRMSLGGPMPTPPDGAVKASVSVEEISRKYYEAAGYSMWITAMHVDPLELIASDDTDGKFYRIPVELSGGEFTFGDPAEVAINYVDVPTAAKALPYRWGTRAAALAAAGVTEPKTEPAKPEVVVPVADDVSPAGAAIRKMAATAVKDGTEDDTQTPDVEPAADSTDNPKEASVDAAKIREALGLSASASDDEVRDATLAALGTTTPPAGPSTDDLGAMEALTGSGQAILVDKAQLSSLIETARKGEIAYNQNRRNERDAFLSTAVREGRIPPASLSAYERLWDNDPEGTRKTVSLLARNIIPVASLGVNGQELDLNEADASYVAMYGKVGA